MKIVVKIGSNIVADGKDGLNEKRMSAIASEIAELRRSGHEVVVVSSGAIAAGIRKFGLKEKPVNIRLKQAVAAVGQSRLMWTYDKCFAEHDATVAQVLLSRDDLSDRKRYINAKNTLIALLANKILPIINENDTVATEEIKFGDNDQLAALVASLIEADRLIILSDVDGLHTADPRTDPKAELIGKVEKITHSLLSKAGTKGSAIGTGGMYSKLVSAEKAIKSGITVNIISGKRQGLMIDIVMNGKEHGTEFKAEVVKLSARKGWLAFGTRAKGSVVVDDGARKALVDGNKSLLPSGIVEVHGHFQVGDAVYCVDTGGQRIAKGLTNYASSEIRKVKGRKTSEIEGILGYRYSDEVIHRDNMVITKQG